ncbi:dihydrofolate reductase family protein [Deinococcus ficus]|uniref:Bacterial bifunctional deaminase-reductase C-terminal domain-containing protein n=1 Tax=Deinococcus ficus TaxID=317577 RepID=A0A221T1A7_9DEIO|nr:dihydrofolate reductase family protein [Deinococcus ficus]ASN82688.1 hypothetical protein DFI_16125 [Deinococcus ficus]
MTPPLLVFIACSLDGFIARKDDDIDWLTQAPTAPGEDHGYAAFMARVDTVVMGRRTFDKIKGFEPWPFDGRRVLVLSRTLRELPGNLQHRAELHAGSIPDLLPNLAASRGVYVDGGQVIRSFLQHGLIEEMTVTRLPVLLGTGLPLFGDMSLQADQWWDVTAARVYPVSGFVQTTYRRRGQASPSAPHLPQGQGGPPPPDLPGT